MGKKFIISESEISEIRKMYGLVTEQKYMKKYDGSLLNHCGYRAIERFEETSGSTSGAKLIPYTAQSLLDFRAAVLPWLASLARRYPAITRGPAYIAISPATRQPKLSEGGILIGLGSEAAYLGTDLVPAMASLLAVAPSVAGIADVETWRLETLAQLVECADLAFMSVWSPTFLSSLLHVLEEKRDAVAHRVSPEAQCRLDATIAGPTPDFSRLWPALACVSCWMDGTSASFARDLQTMLPRVAFEAKGLLATEAAVTTPVDLGDGAIRAVPAIRSGFYEFIDAKGATHGVFDLVEGETYRCLVTTSGGLYRYDLGDSVECTGFFGQTGIRAPALRFVGRDRLSDLVGEKLSEAFVAPILARLPVLAALRPIQAPIAGYELLVEKAPGTISDESAHLGSVEAALLANVHYAYARKIGQLAPLRLREVPRLTDLFASDIRHPRITDVTALAGKL